MYQESPHKLQVKIYIAGAVKTETISTELGVAMLEDLLHLKELEIFELLAPNDENYKANKTILKDFLEKKIKASKRK